MKKDMIEIEISKYNYCFYNCVLLPIGNVETSYYVDEFWGGISTFKEYQVENLDFTIDYDKVVIVDDNGDEISLDDIEDAIIQECYDRMKKLYYRELMEELISNQ